MGVRGQTHFFAEFDETWQKMGSDALTLNSIKLAKNGV
jgi:hypothetical protein